VTIDEFYTLMQKLRIRHSRARNQLFLDHRDVLGGNIMGAYVFYKRTMDKQTIVSKVNFCCRSPEMDEVRMHCMLHGIEVLGYVYTRDPSPLEEEFYARGRYRDNRTKSK
jgi:hypothetical protein